MAFALLDNTVQGSNFTYTNGDKTVEYTSGTGDRSTKLNKSFAYTYRRYYVEVVADVVDTAAPFTNKMHIGLVPVNRFDDTDSLRGAEIPGSQYFINTTNSPSFERRTFDSETKVSVPLDTTDFSVHPFVGAGWDDTDVLGIVIDEVVPSGNGNDGVIQVSYYLNNVHIGTVDSGDYNWRGISWTLAFSLTDVNDKITIRTDPADWSFTAPHLECFPLADGGNLIRQTGIDNEYTRLTSGAWPGVTRRNHNPQTDGTDTNLAQMLWDNINRLVVISPQDGATGALAGHAVQAFATKSHTRGKKYFEIELTSGIFPSPAEWEIGIFQQPVRSHVEEFGFTGWRYNLSDNALKNVDTDTAGISSVFTGITNGDIIMFAVDMDKWDPDASEWKPAIYIGRNGTWHADPAVDTDGSWDHNSGLGSVDEEGITFYHLTPGVKYNHTTTNPKGNEKFTFNFGAIAFAHTIPSGYSDWDSTTVPAL